MRLTATIAAAFLLAGSAVASAHADTYAWTAGQDSGTFTTGAASPVGAGYFLLTDFFFATADTGDALFTNEDVASFHDNASYNPSQNAFGNNYAGNFYTDTSDFENNDIKVSAAEVGFPLDIMNKSTDGEGVSAAVFTVVADLSTPPPRQPRPSPLPGR